MRKLKTILISVALLATLGACAYMDNWEKEGVTEAERALDLKRCDMESFKAAQRGGPTLLGAAMAREALERCMMEKGYVNN